MVNKDLEELYKYQNEGKNKPDNHREDRSLEACLRSMKDKTLYGEITKEGVENLIEELSAYITPETVFYDVGSGYGTMVLHMAICTEIKRSVGVEFMAERCEYAEERIPGWKYKSQNLPEFYCTDFNDHDFSDATLVYCDNTVLREEIVNLFEKLPEGCVLVVRSTLHLKGCSWNLFSANTTYGTGHAHWTVVSPK